VSTTTFFLHWDSPERARARARDVNGRIATGLAAYKNNILN